MVERGILLEEAVTEFEKKFIKRVLERLDGNQSRAAKVLGIHRNTLSRKVGTYKLDFNPAGYLGQTADYLRAEDVLSGLVKAAVFGFIIALVGCYHGYHSRGGAEGVGAATTASVVSASIMILLFDSALTSILF